MCIRKSKNLYTRSYTPLRYILEEERHAKGFSPDPAAADIADGIELPFLGPPMLFDEGLLNEQIRSSLSLPVRLNQWVGTSEVWTKMVPPFKYISQQGYTAHATFEEAEKEALKMIHLYKKIVHQLVAIPVVTGRKSGLETLGGALFTYTIEAMMGDEPITGWHKPFSWAELFSCVEDSSII